MRSKIISLIVSALFLTGMLFFASDIRTVKANMPASSGLDYPGPVYILANGTVTPSKAPIQRSGNDYTLTGNITSSTSGIIVEKSNVTINGAGYTLNGSGTSAGGYGFNLTGVNHVTIKNTTIKNFSHGIYLTSSSNYNTVSGNKITANSGWGIWLVSCSNNTVSGNNVTHSYYGIVLALSSNYNTVSGNKITANNYDGIELTSSCSYNTVSGNNITSNNEDGIELDYSPNNTVSGNNITANSEAGIYLYYSSSNTVSGNNVANDTEGIYFDSSSSNTVSGNNVANDTEGIQLDSSSSGNIIYHNNFVNNPTQALAGSSVNVWDDGYPSGGNYWSDYLTKYPTAVEVDSLDYWSKPYVINTSNTDNYPLMAPFRTFTAGTWNSVTYHVDIVSNSTITGFSFSATSKTITFNVTGQTGTRGFCRVDIPTSLLSCANTGDWTVIVGTTLMSNRTVIVSGNYTYIYFSYTHSTHQVMITGTSVVPEFPSALTLTLILLTTLFAAVLLAKKRKPKTSSHPYANRSTSKPSPRFPSRVPLQNEDLNPALTRG